jgi:hypothetical protein
MGEKDATPKAVTKVRHDSDAPPRGKKLLKVVGGVIGAVAVLGGVFFGVVLPRMVASSLHDTASGAGVVIAYESPSFHTSGVELSGFEATFPALPGTTLKARRVHSSFSGSDVVIEGGELVSQSAPDEIIRAVRAAESQLPKGLRLDDLKVSYAYAPDLVLEGSGGSVSATDGSRLELKLPDASLKTSAGSLGPFTVDAKHDDNQATLHIAPAAGAHLGASFDITWAGSGAKVSAHAPRGTYPVPVKSLGIAQDDSLDLAADLDATANEFGDVTGTGKLSVYGVLIGAQPHELTWEFTLTGKPSSLTAQSTRARIGPFSGQIRGQWAAIDRKSAIFSFHTDQVPCADVARAKAKQGNVPALLADVADYTGVATVTGNASAAGAITLLLDTPPKVKSSVTENDTCGLAIFPK